LKIVTTDQLAQRNGIKVLVYGRAGMGKTTLCGTAPAPLIISAESGLMPLRHKKIPVIEVTEIKDVWDAFTWLRSSAEARHVRTVCLDSLSEIAEKVLEAEKKKTKDGRAAYGGLIDQMIPLTKAFRDLPGKHVVVTAKEDQTVNGVTGVSRYAPKAPGQTVGPELPYLFDEVFHASVGKDANGATYYYLRTKPDAQVDAKDRSGVLAEIEYPDLTAIFNKIEKGA
jgi:hypothetical protein